MTIDVNVDFSFLDDLKQLPTSELLSLPPIVPIVDLGPEGFHISFAFHGEEADKKRKPFGYASATVPAA